MFKLGDTLTELLRKEELSKASSITTLSYMRLEIELTYLVSVYKSDSSPNVFDLTSTSDSQKSFQEQASDLPDFKVSDKLFAPQESLHRIDRDLPLSEIPCVDRTQGCTYIEPEYKIPYYGPLPVNEPPRDWRVEEINRELDRIQEEQSSLSGSSSWIEEKSKTNEDVFSILRNESESTSSIDHYLSISSSLDREDSLSSFHIEPVEKSFYDTEYEPRKILEISNDDVRYIDEIRRKQAEKFWGDHESFKDIFRDAVIENSKTYLDGSERKKREIESLLGCLKQKDDDDDFFDVMINPRLVCNDTFIDPKEAIIEQARRAQDNAPFDPREQMMSVSKKEYIDPKEAIIEQIERTQKNTSFDPSEMTKPQKDTYINPVKAMREQIERTSKQTVHFEDPIKKQPRRKVSEEGYLQLKDQEELLERNRELTSKDLHEIDFILNQPVIIKEMLGYDVDQDNPLGLDIKEEVDRIQKGELDTPKKIFSDIRENKEIDWESEMTFAAPLPEVLWDGENFSNEELSNEERSNEDEEKSLEKELWTRISDDYFEYIEENNPVWSYKDIELIGKYPGSTTLNIFCYDKISEEDKKELKHFFEFKIRPIIEEQNSMLSPDKRINNVIIYNSKIGRRYRHSLVDEIGTNKVAAVDSEDRVLLLDVSSREDLDRWPEFMIRHEFGDYIARHKIDEFQDRIKDLLKEKEVSKRYWGLFFNMIENDILGDYYAMSYEGGDKVWLEIEKDNKDVLRNFNLYETGEILNKFSKSPDREKVLMNYMYYVYLGTSFRMFEDITTLLKKFKRRTSKFTIDELRKMTDVLDILVEEMGFYENKEKLRKKWA